MRCVFGPVPSRRLGQSLGIDTIPLKTCNWNCVYCQLGRSRPLVNERQVYFPPEDILSEVRQTLEAHKPGEIDWVTFVGSGEPTLHANLGWLIDHIKALTDLPIAVITNGAFFYLPEVRQELAFADAVLPTLDAGTPALYRRINRPHPDISFDRLVGGLKAFRREYKGKLWLEMMLVKELNDTEEALSDLAAVLRQIQPDEIHINLPIRPPAETWVQTPDEGRVLRAVALLGDVAHVVHPIKGIFDLSGSADVVDAIIGIVSRHPIRQDELEQTLAERWTVDQVRQVLQRLADSGQARLVERHGALFWSATSAYYPDETHSQFTRPT